MPTLPQHPRFAMLKKTSLLFPQFAWLADLEADPIDTLPARTDVAAEVAVVGVGLYVDTLPATVGHALGGAIQRRRGLRRGRGAGPGLTCLPGGAGHAAGTTVCGIDVQVDAAQDLAAVRQAAILAASAAGHDALAALARGAHLTGDLAAATVERIGLQVDTQRAALRQGAAGGWDADAALAGIELRGDWAEGAAGAAVVGIGVQVDTDPAAVGLVDRAVPPTGGGALAVLADRIPCADIGAGAAIEVVVLQVGAVPPFVVAEGLARAASAAIRFLLAQAAAL